MANKLQVGFGRAMMSPYRWDDAQGTWALNAEGKKILMYEPLAGYGNDTSRLCKNGRSEGTNAEIYDKDLAFEMYVSCVAYQDERKDPLLHFSVDTCMAAEELTRRVREAITARMNVRPERIYCNGTHTHSGICFFVDGYCSKTDPTYLNVFTDSDGKKTNCLENLKFAEDNYVRACVQAAEQALADLALVTDMKTGTVVAAHGDGKYYNYVRHFPLVAKEDHSIPLGVLGPNFNHIGEKYLVDGKEYTSGFNSGENGELPAEGVAHMTVANHNMMLLWIERDAKEPVAVCNFRAHATVQSGGLASISRYGVQERACYSPDFIGPFRDYVEHQLGCKCAYFQGDCGNCNPKGQFSWEQIPEITRQNVDLYDQEGQVFGKNSVPNDFGVYGQLLGKLAVKSFKKKSVMKECLGDARVESAQNRRLVPFRSGGYYTEIGEGSMKIAQEMVDYFRATYNTPAYDVKNIEKMAAASAGEIHSFYHAANVINRKAMTPQAQPMEMNAYRVGEVAFTLSPYEMFDTNGDRVREAGESLKYKNTLVCGYTNDWVAYVPSELGFTQGASLRMAGATDGTYKKADGSEVPFDTPVRGLFGCYEADQCKAAPVLGPDMKPLYGTYDGTDGVHKAGDPVYVGEYLADTLADLLADIR